MQIIKQKANASAGYKVMLPVVCPGQVNTGREGSTWKWWIKTSRFLQKLVFANPSDHTILSNKIILPQ